MPEPGEPRAAVPEEIPTEHQRIYDEMLGIARSIPAPIAAATERIEQFGNNFFLLFLELKNGEDNMYLQRAKEKYGDKWGKFLTDNGVLVDEILKALDKIEIYSKLLNLYSKLLFDSKSRPSRQFAERVAGNTKFNEIGVDAWKVLNPLLKQASEAMIVCGIKPEDFYS